MNEGKQILFCASSSSHILNFHLPYLKHFKSLGYTIHTATDSEILHDYIDVSHVLPFSKNTISPNNIRAIFMLRDILKRFNFCLLSTHSTLAGAVGRLACRGKVPTLHTSHGYLFSDDGSLSARFKLSIERYLSRYTDCLMVMNSEDYATAKRYELASKIRYINGMGIDSDRFSITHVRSGRFTFVCIGEFSRRKNQCLIIDAFKRLNCDAHLIFAGEGKLKKRCEKLARGSAGIEFIGHCEDVAGLLSKADAVCTASLSEGLPFNVMEAMLSGILVIASDVKGHVDLIKDGENGLLFASGSADELCRCMEQAVAGVEISSALDGIFSIKSVFVDIIGCYNEYISK